MLAAEQYLAEVMRALCVLGLLLFVVTPGASPDLPQNYGQIGASTAVAASIAAAQLSPLCGGGWGSDQLCHAPCHACRAGLPVLPAAPSIAEPAFRAVVPAAYAAAPQRSARPALAYSPPSRGPPVA